MGYTHKYGFKNIKKEFNEDEIRVVREIAEEYKEIIRLEIGTDNLPEIESNRIRFNGIMEKGCETFVIQPDTREEFCKTGEYEYDLPVCEVLLAIKYFNGKNFRLDSDGFWISKEEADKYIKEGKVNLDGKWNEAIEKMEKKYGMKFVFDLEISGKEIKYYHFNMK